MKLYERIENNNFDEIDKNRAIELIEGGNGHLVYNENYFKLQKENEELNLKYSMLYNGKIEKMKAQEVKIKSQVIPVYKVKDKIKKLRAEYEYLGEENKRVNKFEIELLQELIKGD